jgi:aspartyl-tRNA(Asn)/glutamyl-tRNA(Gln) amidotransferase subunit A
MAERSRLRAEVDRRLADFDGLLLPTTPIAAVPLTQIDQSQAPMSRLTRPVNYLDLCALALPCGFTGTGLPVSLQVVGRAYDEARVLRIGRAYEAATEWHRRRPAVR